MVCCGNAFTLRRRGLSSPVLAVEISVAQCFAYMVRGYLGAVVEVGYRARYFQYPVVCAGGEVQTFDGRLQHFRTFRIERAVLAHHLRGHLRVAVYARLVLETFSLYVPRGYDPAAYLAAWL